MWQTLAERPFREAGDGATYSYERSVSELFEVDARRAAFLRHRSPMPTFSSGLTCNALAAAILARRILGLAASLANA